MGVLGKYGRWSLLLLSFAAALLGATKANAAACTSVATGNWNAATTWAAPCNVAGGPVAADTVTIAAAHTVTVTANAAATSITVAAPSVAAHGVNINPGITLNVSGAVTMTAPATNARTSTFAVGAGTLNAGSISIGGGTATKVSQVTVSTGTITTTGNIAFVGTAGNARFVSTGASTVNVGGNFASGGTLTTGGTGTINFNGGAAQTIGAYTTYNNISINNTAGGVSLAGNATIGGALLVNTGTLTVGAFTLAVTGTTTVNGAISITSATGTKTFTGAVTINPGGSWTNTTEAVAFRGGLTHNGAAFTAGTGIYTFSTTAAQALNCATALAIPSLTATSPTVLTNNCPSLTVATALAGTGNLTNAAAGVLNIGGTSAITTLTATAVGNTVNYTGAAQTVKATPYYHLGLGGSGAKTLTGVTTIAGNLAMSGTATASAAAAMTIGGKLTIGSTNTFANGTRAINVAGDFEQNGTFTAGSGVFTLNGGAAVQTISGTGALGFANLTVNNTGGITLVRNVTVTSAITGAVTLTSTCPADYTLTSSGGATVVHSCNQNVVASINRTGATPTNAASVSWTVIFSQSVAGVTSANFSLVNNGLGGTPAITSVSGAGTTWTVTASTGTGSGTLGLDMANSTGVTPAVNYLPFTGQAYTLDRAAPAVSSIVRVDASPTSLASVSWTVTFDENVTGVDATDFALVQGGGVSGASITAVTPVSGAIYTVTAGTGAGNGSLGLNLADNDSIIDAFGNPLGGAGAGNGDFTGEAYTVVRPRVYYMYFNTGTVLTQPAVTTNTACPSPVDTTLAVSGIGLMADADDLTCVPAANRDVRWTTATPTLSMYYNGAGYTAAKDVTGISVGIRVRSNTATAILTARLFYTTAANVQVYFSGVAATQAVTSTRTEYTVSLAGQSATNVPAGSKIGIEFSWNDPLGVRLAVNASINSEKLIVQEADVAAVPPDHLEIQHASGTGVTCTPSTLAIKACADAACATAYTAGVGGISGTLSATGAGMTVNWSGGTGFFIAEGSSSVTKDVQVTTVGNVAFGATSPSIAGTTTCNFGLPSCTFTAADSGFLVSVPNHVAETSQAFTLTAVKKAGNSAVCVPGLTGSKTVNLKCVYTNPGSGTLPVRVAGTALNAGGNAASACDGSGANVGLTFSAAGVATSALQYADVGQVTLTASYSGAAGAMEDGLAMSGATSFIAAPAAFEVVNQTAGTIRAGNPFGVSVRALNSLTDVTPNFGKDGEGVTVSSILVDPDPTTYPTVSNPALGNNVIAGSEFGAGGMDATDVDGEATVSNLSWGEVGSIRLAATLTSGDYLGSGLTASGVDAGTTGPFIPHHFDTVVVPTPTTPMPCPVGLVCPVSFNGFVYSGQPFSVQVTARNLTGDPTANYHGSFGLSNEVTLKAWDALGSTTTENPGGGGLANGVVAAADFGTTCPKLPTGFESGCAMSEVLSYKFTAVETAPTNIFLRATDTSVTSLRTVPADSVEGGVKVASGRIKLSNGHGSELLALPLAATVLYYNGSYWVSSTTDTVTTLLASDVALDFPVATANKLAACETVLSVTGSSPTFALKLGKPGSGNNGWTNLTLNLGATATGSHCANTTGGATTTANRPWLQFPVGSNPTARATFGVYKGNNEFIYLRENY